MLMFWLIVLCCLIWGLSKLIKNREKKQEFHAKTIEPDTPRVRKESERIQKRESTSIETNELNKNAVKEATNKKLGEAVSLNSEPIRRVCIGNCSTCNREHCIEDR